MEIGETVAASNASQKQGKCVICNKDHPDPKKEQIQATAPKAGWERTVSMVGVFDSGDSTRRSVYPASVFPPPYSTEGHHCMALTSFIKANKDRCATLNHFLNKVGFKPNDPPNIMQLPGRSGIASPAAPGITSWPKGAKTEYKSFWASIDHGRPLQLHIGRHRGEYFKASDALYLRLLQLIADPDACEEDSKKEIEDALKEAAKGAVNLAFTRVASADWKCHPEHLRIAADLYTKTGTHTYTYQHKTRRERVSRIGYPGTGSAPAPWPKLSLTTTPF